MTATCEADWRAGLPAATERRLTDAHLTETEAGLVRRLQHRSARTRPARNRPV
ncbi:hypothetical protein ACIQAC_35695 [Streptomyces sp. NPDC088387]|uniref:hypothetical protein n=1 Tax=Streptomyces sp. NPDC088387 TaxID=3365859 RepID=UPI003814259D